MKLKTILILMFITVSLIPIGIISGIEGLQASTYLIMIMLGVTFFVSLMISYLITRPIENLTNQIECISKGKLDVEMPNSEIYEINQLVESLDRVMASLKLAIHKVGVKKGEIFEEKIEKQNEDILKSLTGWAWEIDENGTYVYCSINVQKYLGLKPEEIIGQNFYDFIKPEQKNKIKQTFDLAGKKNMPIKIVENSVITTEGQYTTVITNAFPFYDKEGNLLGYRGVDIDIMREIDAKEQIKQLNTELNSLKIEISELLNTREKTKDSKYKLRINTNPKKTPIETWSEHKFDSIFITDEKANILDCNDNMTKRLGYSKSEMLKLNMSDFDALETKKDIINKIQIAKKDGSIIFKTIHKRKDGSAILVKENVQYDKEKQNFKCIVREDYDLKKNKK